MNGLNNHLESWIDITQREETIRQNVLEWLSSAIHYREKFEDEIFWNKLIKERDFEWIDAFTENKIINEITDFATKKIYEVEIKNDFKFQKEHLGQITNHIIHWLDTKQNVWDEKRLWMIEDELIKDIEIIQVKEAIERKISLVKKEVMKDNVN